jgi:hypothetical protein
MDGWMAVLLCSKQYDERGARSYDTRDGENEMKPLPELAAVAIGRDGAWDRLFKITQVVRPVRVQILLLLLQLVGPPEDKTN